jgi:hypothetical protein
MVAFLEFKLIAALCGRAAGPKPSAIEVHVEKDDCAILVANRPRASE